MLLYVAMVVHNNSTALILLGKVRSRYVVRIDMRATYDSTSPLGHEY